MAEQNAIGFEVLDEDNMASDSATAVATQQSIKAYVDNSLAGNVAVVEGRLTLLSNTPVIDSVTAATTVYFTPYLGNNITIYNGTNWVNYTFTQISIAVPATTDTNYDIFIYDNSGTPTLELVAWTNDVTRATALTTQDGVYVKSGDTTRMYLGMFRTTGVAGETENSPANRYLWNYYNRVNQTMKAFDTTDSWTYSTATYRQANASTSNQLNFVIGVQEDVVNAQVTTSLVVNSTATPRFCKISIGLSSTTLADTDSTEPGISMTSTVYGSATAIYCGYPGVGRYFLAWLEYGGGTDTQTWYGDNGSGAPTIQNGMTGTILG